MFSSLRRRQRPNLKLFFATDIHGSERCFRKFVNAAKFYDIDVLILGGDLAGKAMIPIIEYANGSFRATYLGREHNLQTEQEVKEFKKLTAEAGFYSFRIDPDELELLQNDSEKRDARFLSLMTQRLHNWVELADARLKPQGVRLYFTGGNDDPEDILAATPGSEWVVNTEGDVHDIGGGYTLASCGYSNITPWQCPRDISEEELTTKLEEVSARIQEPAKCIFNFHVPPVDSSLDTCPKLDTSTWPPTPVVQNGQTVSIGAGSSAVRKVIESYQPILGLHGHIHESRNVAHLGRTFCINPGSEYAEGVLRGALVLLTDEGIKNHQLTSG